MRPICYHVSYISVFLFYSQVLQAMLESQVTQEQLECIVDRTIQEADLDNDDAISFEEFRKVKYCITLLVALWLMSRI